MDRVLDGLTTCVNFKLSDRAPPDKIALAEGGTMLFETRSIDTVGGLLRSIWPDQETGHQLSLKFKHVVKPSSTRSMAERKGQVYANKWADLVQLRWVLEAREHYPGNHEIYGSADRNLERIRRLFGNLLSFAWKWSVDLVASLYFFYSGRYLL